MPKDNSISRREFIQIAGVGGLLTPFSGFAGSNAAQKIGSKQDNTAKKIHIFSKHLHWLDYQTMASFIAECGFDGVDLTVRKDGHVEPDRVKEDLPRAIEVIKKAGKEVTMITTAIRSADEPHAEEIIRTAAEAGVLYYRLGWLGYESSLSIEENYRTFEKSLQGLIRLNQQYKIKGAYQNHAGTSLGSAVWDFAHLLNTLNSPWMGCQYDIRHATVEGANTWPLGFDYIKPHINSLDIKDFHWTKENERWKPQNVPLGQGMVDFEKFFEKIRALPSTIPISLHLEYPLGGAEHGSRNITLSPEEIKKAMMRDLKFIRERL